MIYAEWQQALSARVELPTRPLTDPTWAWIDPAGSERATGTASRDPVDTTLAAAAAAGSTTVSVSLASGITIGRRYLIGGAEHAGGERVTVRDVSGTQVTLVRPLRTGRPAGTLFQSTDVTANVPAAATQAIGNGYRLRIAVSPPVVRVAAVVRHLPTSSLSAEDIVDMDPLLAKRLPSTVWLPAMIQTAWDQLLARVWQRVSIGALVAPADLTTVHAYWVRALLAEIAGDEWVQYRDFMRTRAQEELDAVLASTAIDENQDGAVRPHEQWRRHIDVARG